MMTFCESCHDMVAYSIQNVMMEKEVKGKLLRFEGRKAYCPSCENELFVSELHDYNLEQLDIAYRKSENLITISEIQQLLEKYDIGKRPLANLLGWGEITLTRYVDGAIPTRSYSDRLYALLNDSAAMAYLLSANKEAISELAYKKSKKAVDLIKEAQLTGSVMENKIESVVKYLLSNLSEVTPLALQKLLYYSQGFGKVFKGDYLFKEDCEAWSHGPVYADIYQKYKTFGYNPIDMPMTNDTAHLNITQSEREILDSVINYFGCYSGKVLEKMTHSEHPWLITRNGLDDEIPSQAIIEKHLIGDYFEQIKRKYTMLNTSDIKDYSHDLFSKLMAQ